MVPKSCSIEDCQKPCRAQGLCEMHYRRLRRHGDPLKNLVAEKPKVCTFEDCGKPVAGRGLCSTHWARWRTHGDPNIVIRGSKPQHVGCNVGACEEKHHSKGYCSTHAARFKKNGDPLVAGDHYPGRPRMAAPSYDGVHKRLHREKGKANTFPCADCGERASEWSYDGGCPDELYETLVKVPVAYSVDQSRYSPRCLKCHRRRDESLNRERGNDGRWVA